MAKAKNYEGTLKGMYGLKTYYQDGDNLEHLAKAQTLGNDVFCQ